MNGRFCPKAAAEGTGRETTPARPLYTPTKGQQSPDLIACVGNVSGCPIRKKWWARQDYSPRNTRLALRAAAAMRRCSLASLSRCSSRTWDPVKVRFRPKADIPLIELSPAAIDPNRTVVMTAQADLVSRFNRQTNKIESWETIELTLNVGVFRAIPISWYQA
jgi:hypothetical protein